MRLTLSSWPCRQSRAAVIRISADLALDHRVFAPDRDEVRFEIAEAIRASAAPPRVELLPPMSAA